MAGIIMLFVFGSQLLEPFFRADDIWWTPRQLAVPLTESRPRVEIFVGDRILGDLISGGDLLLIKESETVTVKMEDVNLRFNNYANVMASEIPWIVLDSIITTLALVLIVIGVIPYFRKQNVIKPAGDG